MKSTSSRKLGRRGRDADRSAFAGLVVVAVLLIPALVLTGPVDAPLAGPVFVGTASAQGQDGSAMPGAISQGMRSPLSGPPTAVTPFDPPDQRWKAGHRGVDLAATPLAPVLAPTDGAVSFAGVVAGRPVLSIDHGAGLRTTYEPVRATVRQGDAVRAGETVGYLVAGHPGCPVEACLHWGARVASGGPGGDDDDYVDPMALLLDTARPIALKPTRPGDGEG